MRGARAFTTLSWRNLGRNRKRNLATGSAIAFGFAGILLLAAYTHRAKNYVRVNTVYGVHTGHLAFFAPGGFAQFLYQPGRYSLSAEDQRELTKVLSADPGVERFEKQIRGQGLIGNGCLSFPFVAEGIDPAVDEELWRHPEVKEWMPDFRYIREGRGLANYPPELGAVLLSRGLALALGKTRLHDQVASTAAPTIPDCTKPREQAARDANVQLLSGAWAGQISAADGEVVGIFSTGFQESDNSGLVTSVFELQKLFETDRVTEMAVWLRRPDELSAVRNRLEAALAARGKHFEVLNWDEERLSPYYRGTVDFLNTLVVAGGLVLSSIVALSVLNSATMTILERSQEIGMYRAMGFRRSQLRVLYVEEALWLALLALGGGLLLAVITIRAVNSAGIVYHPPGVAGGLRLVLVLPALPTLVTALLLLALAGLATLFAVSSRLRLRPAELLGGPSR